MACAGISTTTGMFMIFLLGSLLPWRQVAFICTIIPICNIVVAYFVGNHRLQIIQVNDIY